jgi:hypothetical protein
LKIIREESCEKSETGQRIVELCADESSSAQNRGKRTK